MAFIKYFMFYQVTFTHQFRTRNDSTSMQGNLYRQQELSHRGLVERQSEWEFSPPHWRPKQYLFV